MDLTPPPGTRFRYRKSGDTIFVRAETLAGGVLGYGNAATVEQAHAQALEIMQTLERLRTSS